MSPSKQQQPTSIYSNHDRLIKSQFAHRFVRALNILNSSSKRSSSPQYADYDNQIIYQRRCRRVKLAAYTAMASVVGSRRAWSRAVLQKILNRSRNMAGCLMLSNNNAKKIIFFKRRRNLIAPKLREVFNKSAAMDGQEWKLRKLIPGAETMDSWCLIGETTDYIKCLAAQVDVMKTLVDLYTTA